MRRLASVLVLMLALGACGKFNFARHTEATPEPTETGSSEVGGSLRLSPQPSEEAPAPASSRSGTAVLTVLDRTTGHARSDVPVRFTPAGKGTARLYVSNARGIVTAVLPEGFYSADVVAGCGEHVVVTYGERADLGVTAGSSITATLDVSATRRFSAGPPVFFADRVPWPRTRDVTFYYELYDRCETDDAPNRSVPSMRYLVEGPLKVVGDSTIRSDERSLVRVVVRCIGAGDPKLYLIDPQNDTDRVDLLSIRRPPPDTHWCA